ALNNYMEKFESRAIVPPSDEEDKEVMLLIEFDLRSRQNLLEVLRQMRNGINMIDWLVCGVCSMRIHTWMLE
ncbi:hypothetical protein S83_004401, partial [Arachis hypogaea]